jgi:hypothetical protein
MTFKVGQLVRFCNVSAAPGLPDEGTIGVVTEISRNHKNPYPYSVKWFLGKPETEDEYAEIELEAVDEI